MIAKKYYVTMTDKALSGWGMAKNKINKLVFECVNTEEVDNVIKVAESKPEMKYINVSTRKPKYNQNRYYVSFKTRETAKAWYN